MTTQLHKLNKEQAYQLGLENAALDLQYEEQKLNTKTFVEITAKTKEEVLEAYRLGYKEGKAQSASLTPNLNTATTRLEMVNLVMEKDVTQVVIDKLAKSKSKVARKMEHEINSTRATTPYMIFFTKDGELLIHKEFRLHKYEEDFVKNIFKQEVRGFSRYVNDKGAWSHYIRIK